MCESALARLRVWRALERYDSRIVICSNVGALGWLFDVMGDVHRDTLIVFGQ